uniref:Vacuole membrane protein 1 n=1 Tax=Clastoptera arizonana TaxID=38151 RepID=A0A1B6CZY1_9HEMI
MGSGNKRDTLRERKILSNSQKVSKSSDSHRLKDDLDKLVVWRSPFLTTYYFVLEVGVLLQMLWSKMYDHKKKLLSSVAIFILLFVLSQIKGPHQATLQYLWGRFSWSMYWMGLGVLSSIGLGTGLHTFVMYLGPHIASVTLAGYECGGLNFPEPPYPQQIICPSQIDPRWVVSVWNIMWKVRLESIMWGAGTALGELPPYFMARASKRSGAKENDLQELENLQSMDSNSDDVNFIDRMKLMVQVLIQKVGFFGILACASIPNPLFDLAGIMCGHFEVPFWTFFGATLLGKAVIKMMLQKFFVIVAFSDTLMERLLDSCSYVPILGPFFQTTVSQLLAKQKAKLYNPTDSSSDRSIFELGFQLFIISMILYFIVSIINSFAQTNYKKSKNKRLNFNSKKISKD